MSREREQETFFQLLRYLHRGGTYGFWCYESIAKKPNSSQPEERESLWWKSEDPSQIPWHTGMHGQRNIWYGVNPCSCIPSTSCTGKEVRPEYVRSQTAIIQAINCLYAEYDAKDFEGSKETAFNHLVRLKVEPSVIIDSGGGYHCYWLLDKTQHVNDENRDSVRAMQHSWVRVVEGDMGAKNLNRVLRVPGTYNHKRAYSPDYPMVKFVHADLQKTYRLDALRSLIPEETNQRSSSTETRNYSDDERETAARILPMLAPHRADDHDTWVNAGQALCFLGQEGFYLWDRWSSQSPKYDRRECARRWETFKTGSLTIKTIMRWAKEDSPVEYEREIKRSSSTAPLVRTTERKGKDNDCDGDVVHEEHEELDRSFLFLGAHDEGNAETVYRLHGKRFAFCESYGWMLYTGTHWERDGAELDLDRAIVDSLKRRRKLALDDGEFADVAKSSTPHTSKVRSAKYLLKSWVARRVADFDRHTDWLNVSNGTINLETGELLNHSPDHMFTYCIDVPYSPEADQTEWLNFLESIIEEDKRESIIDYLQVAIGYSLTGHTSEETMWFIHGPTRSGKGTFTETLLALMGNPLSTEVSFSTFSRDRDTDASNFDLAPLKAARCIFASESNKHERLNVAEVKRLTGGNMVHCCFKGQTHFSYQPQYKIWLTSNYPPNADVDDDALWGRMRVVTFPISRLGKEDKSLKSRLRSTDALQGVLAWAVEGAVAWYDGMPDGIDTPDIVADQNKSVRERLDTIQQWLDECIEHGLEATVWSLNADVYKSYIEWADANGVTPKKQKAFTQALNRKGIDGTTPKKILGKTQRVWLGVQVK